MRKIEDVLRLHARGLSTRRISLATGVGKTTVIEYLRRAGRAGLSWPLPEGLDEAALERLLFPLERAPARRAGLGGDPSRTEAARGHARAALGRVSQPASVRLRLLCLL